MSFPEKYALNNISGTINVLNAMSAHNVKNLVFSSSAAVYGMPEYLPIDEQHPLNPINFTVLPNTTWKNTLNGTTV